MKQKTVLMVHVPPGKWQLVQTKGKGHLIKLGPFEEWVAKRVVEITEEGDLYVSSAFLKKGTLWTQILRNYKTVRRPVRELGIADDGDEDDD